MDHMENYTCRQQSRAGAELARLSAFDGPEKAGDESVSGQTQPGDSVTLSTAARKKPRPHKEVPLQCVCNPASVRGEEKEVVVGNPKATGYYPSEDPVQGGYVDMHDKPLCTLQDHVAGKVSYVSLAFDRGLYDSGAISYGNVFSIPELDEKYGKHLIFKSVDTGSAFAGKKFTRIDICCKTEQDTFDPSVNQVLTLIKVG